VSFATIDHAPPRAASSAGQNTDGESKRGKHAHSMQPSRRTSAAERQSPINA